MNARALSPRLAALALAALLAACSADESPPPGPGIAWGALYGPAPVVAAAHSAAYNATFALPERCGFRYFDGNAWRHYLTHNSGLRSNDGRALAINPNGIVWIGTDRGVSLFDGSRFSDITAAGTAGGLVSDDVLSLFCDAAGGMWVGTSAGASLYDPTARAWSVLTAGLASPRVTAIGQDAAGNFWFGHDGAGLTRMRPSGFDVFDTANGMASGDVRAIRFDASGHGWFATAAGLHRFDGASFTVYDTSSSAIPSNDVRDVAVDSVGVVWVATAAGLAGFSGTWTLYPATPTGLMSADTRSLAVAPGALWVGTAAGLNRFQGPNVWNRYALGNTDLPSNVVHDVVEDAAGAVWFATDGGLTRFSGPSWTTWDSGTSPLGSDAVARLALDGSRIWLATQTGLYRFDGTAWNRYAQSTGELPSDWVRDLARDPGSGALWIATAGGAVRRDSAGVFTAFTTADGLPSNDVRGASVDAQGTAWFATAAGLARYDGAWSALTAADGLPSDDLRAVAAAPAGLWVGTVAAGVAFYDGASFTLHDASQGKLPSDAVRGICVRGDEAFVATGAGLARTGAGSWIRITEANSPILSDDLDAVRLLPDGDLYLGTRGAGVGVLRIP